MLDQYLNPPDHIETMSEGPAFCPECGKACDIFNIWKLYCENCEDWFYRPDDEKYQHYNYEELEEIYV